jgi:hypothetical protein
MTLHADTRGALTFPLIVFFATLIMGAMLYILFEPMGGTLLGEASNHTSTQAATQGQGYIRQLWDLSWLFIVGFGMLQLIVAAVYEGDVR